MKNCLFKLSILASMILIFSACETPTDTPSDSFTVSGTIEGLDTEYMARYYRLADGTRVTDSIFVENGAFSYTANITEATHIVFWPNVENTVKRVGNGYYPAKSSQFAFFASPGDHISFTGKVTDFVDAYPGGTQANNDLATINQQIFPLLNQAVNLQVAMYGQDENTSEIKAMQDSVTELENRVVKMKKEFIKTHLASEAAAWYLSDMMVRSNIEQEEAIELFRSLDSSLATDTYYKELSMRIAGIESTRVGKIMPDFSTNATADSSQFNLSSLRGKYVLIDFWGTWCGPCIAEMPKVKEYQQKYADKLVILGVNSGDTMEKIIKFMEPKGYDWKQILAGEGDESLVLKLNVAGFPTKFILSPDGEILNRFVGDTEEAFEVLDTLMEE